MKIIHVVIGLGIGGAELMLKRLVEGLNGQDGMQHSVISLTDLGPVGKQLVDSGINVTALGMKNALSIPSTFIKLRRELKKQNPDIVQTWMYHADFLGGLAAKSLGIDNVIWGIRTTDVTLGRSKLTVILRKLCAWLSYRVPKIIVCAADAGRKVHEQVGYDPSKMRVIPNGFDLDKLKATPEQRQALRDECGFTDEEVVIGSVGRFNLIKNQQAFVEAAALVALEHPNARFLMVGLGNSWENSELVGWIRQHDLEDKFVLLGQRSDVPVCLAAMDVFCLHSKTEGFPNVLGEAMAMGLPCVATNVGDVELLMSDRSYISRTTSYPDIANRLNKIIELECEQYFYLSSENRNKIFSGYSISESALKYETVYGEIY